MNLFTMLAQDENIDPAFRRLFAKPEAAQMNQLIRRDALHRHERQFAAEPHTPSAFASLDGIGVIGSDRWRQVHDAEGADQRADERRERDEAGE